MIRALFALLLLAAAPADAATASALIGKPAIDLDGERVGVIQDLIVDAAAGRVVYVIVDAPERFYTLPVRALDENLRLDMAGAGEAAKVAPDPRLRRAARLIGLEVTNPGEGRIGTIADLVFDAQSGKVKQVLVADEDGIAPFPPSVLAHGRFPPLTRWQADHPGPEAEGRHGFVRRPPSTERQRTHDHRFERGY